MIRLDYTFDASAQTITFADPVVEEYLGVIVNRNDGIVIYNSFSPLTTGVLVDQVLTLAYDTSSMADEDVLQIFYADVEKAVSGPLTADELADLVISTQEAVTSAQATDYDDTTVAPTTIIPEMYGRAPEGRSVPVALADEQALDFQNQLRLFQAPIAGTVIELVDCLRYRSIAFQVITSAGIGAGVITFEQSTDGAVWIAVPMFDDSAITTAPVSTLTLAASTTKFFSGPIKHRYFRVRVSTTVTVGTVGILAVYRMTPYLPITNQVAAAANWSSNMAQWGGTNVVTGGVAGVPAVGGNIAAGVAPTTNPITIGGVDTTLLAPLVRRIVTDSYGNQVVVGPALTKNNAAPVVTADAPSDLARTNPTDTLVDILYELKLANSFLKSLVEWSTPGITVDDIESFKKANNF